MGRLRRCRRTCSLRPSHSSEWEAMSTTWLSQHWALARRTTALKDRLPTPDSTIWNTASPAITSIGDLVDSTAVGVSDHPLLTGVDLRALLVQKAEKLTGGQLISSLQPIVHSDGGPLLLAGERDGRRIAVLAFDPR